MIRMAVVGLKPLNHKTYVVVIGAPGGWTESLSQSRRGWVAIAGDGDAGAAKHRTYTVEMLDVEAITSLNQWRVE
jgi:hypothetical protein